MFERRLKIFLGILSTVVVVLLGRAAQLQVAQGEMWRKEANDTLKKVSYVETSRGSILDRTGRELAHDRACTDACVWYSALTPQADPTWLGKLAIGRLRSRGDAYQRAAKAERQAKSTRCGGSWRESPAPRWKKSNQPGNRSSSASKCERSTFGIRAISAR
jgi:cell division protein FtsI/penicillin-binding protein 2